MTPTPEHIERLPIVCLCGSTRFADHFHRANRALTLRGHIVLSVGVFGHSDPGGQHALDDATKSQLDELHLRKIDFADAVLVLNVGGYVGDSTTKEIAYARLHNKPVYMLEPGGEANEEIERCVQIAISAADATQTQQDDAKIRAAYEDAAATEGESG